MKKQISQLLAVTLVCLTAVMAGCAQKYDHKEAQRAEEQELRQVLSQALAQGKGVVLTKYPRRSIWVSADKAHAFAFHQELPDIRGYAAVIAEPGTYYFAGGRVQVDNPRQNVIEVTDLARTVDSVGSAHVAQMLRDQRSAEYAYATLPVYYNSTIGYGHGYWGRRDGYWGRRHYSSPYYGVSMHTDDYRTVRRKVAVHSQTSVWSNTYVITLPNDGRVSNAVNAKPLVASIEVRPGEAVVLDEVYIARVNVDMPDLTAVSEKRVLPASASSASASVAGPDIGPFPVTAVEIKVIPHKPSSLPAVGGIAGPVEEHRRITRGVWLADPKATPETYVFVRKARK